MGLLERRADSFNQGQKEHPAQQGQREHRGLQGQQERQEQQERLDRLVAAAQAGDEDALRDVIAWAMDYLFPAVLTMLYERRGRGTYITETLHTGGADGLDRLRDDAWAITHSACYRMALRIDTFRGRNAFGKKTKFATWVYAIAQNEMRTVMRNRWRERKRYGGSRDEWENPTIDGRNIPPHTAFREQAEGKDDRDPSTGANPSPEQATLDRFESDFLREALEKAPLTPEQREAVVLFHGYGYRQERIATMTGVQIGTVKKRIFDGLRKLRIYMESASDAKSGSSGSRGSGKPHGFDVSGRTVPSPHQIVKGGMPDE